MPPGDVLSFCVLFLMCIMLVCSLISFYNPGDLIENIEVLIGLSSLGVGPPPIVVPNEVRTLSYVLMTISPIPFGILDSLLGFPMLSLT